MTSDFVVPLHNFSTSVHHPVHTGVWACATRLERPGDLNGRLGEISTALMIGKSPLARPPGGKFNFEIDRLRDASFQIHTEPPDDYPFFVGPFRLAA
jgi:hypothetical protein